MRFGQSKKDQAKNRPDGLGGRKPCEQAMLWIVHGFGSGLCLWRLVTQRAWSADDSVLEWYIRANGFPSAKVVADRWQPQGSGSYRRLPEWAIKFLERLDTETAETAEAYEVPVTAAQALSILETGKLPGAV